MRIRLVSDLHVDYWISRTPTPTATLEAMPAIMTAGSRKGRGRALLQTVCNGEFDVLVVAGDLTSGKPGSMLSELCRRLRGRPLMYVLGNHESYGCSSRALYDDIAIAESANENLKVLNGHFVTVLKQTFVGAPLWYPHPSQGGPPHHWVEEQGMRRFRCTWSDAKNIPDLDDWQAEKHERDVETFRSMCSADTIAVSHFLPSYEAVHPRWRGDMSNRYFVVAMDDLILSDKGPKLWLHGHSHEANDVVIGRTRVVSNPCAYPGEKRVTTFNPNLILET